MLLALFALTSGTLLLIWSADRFISGCAAAAHHLGLPSTLIGIVIVGFGTSAPELAISTLAALNGNPDLAIGNAYGSNIANIALVLGAAALVKPVEVESSLLRKELPLLLVVTGLAAYQLMDGKLSSAEGWFLLLSFVAAMLWVGWQGLKSTDDPLSGKMEKDIKSRKMSTHRAAVWIAAGLVLLPISSKILVWGATEIARRLGVSNLIIGLTVVAVGTSLPELASSVAASRREESGLLLGNVIGSNLFNTLAVVGIAGTIHPSSVPAEVFSRDIPVMGGLTVLLFAFCFGIRGRNRINRGEGALLLLSYIGYVIMLAAGALG